MRWREAVDRLAVVLLALVDLRALERAVPVLFLAVDPRPDGLRDDVDFADDDDRRADELRLDFGCGISPIPLDAVAGPDAIAAGDICSRQCRLSVLALTAVLACPAG